MTQKPTAPIPDCETMHTHPVMIAWYPPNARTPSRNKGPSRIYTSGLVTFDRKARNVLTSITIHADGHVEHRIDYVLSRTTGPAVIYADGSKAYWVNNARISPVEFFLKYDVL